MVAAVVVDDIIARAGFNRVIRGGIFVAIVHADIICTVARVDDEIFSAVVVEFNGVVAFARSDCDVGVARLSFNGVVARADVDGNFFI